MAHIYPDVKTINKLKVKPTKGEATLLNFLKNNLPDDFEIYFQPWINMDHPDIIIMKKDSGVMIIEVKDYNLESYDVDNNKNWVLKNINNNSGKSLRIDKSPVKQVNEYKDNLYNLHIETLLEKKIINPSYLSIVNCVLYFHNATKNQIDVFFKKRYAPKDLKYIDLLGSDSLTLENISDILKKQKLTQNSHLFDKTLYESFKRYFQPTSHMREQGKTISYSKKQLELSVSAPVQQKIKGVAGSGKSILLAKRAVNAYERTNSKVLILTYNITLRNYIHDMISDVRRESDWSNFHIIHYHQFINAQTNNLNIVIPRFDKDSGNTAYENEYLFNGHEQEIEKYDAIFIDEIQDFKTQWIKIIKKYFLAENGELVVFGDEKQNIYGTILDGDKKPNTTITGNWNYLNESFRIENVNISELSSRFQDYYFKNRYEKDVVQLSEQVGLPFNDKINHLYFTNNKSPKEIVDIIYTIIKNKNIHPNDICLLSSDTETVRSIDFEIRDQYKERTITTFIPKEFKMSLNKINDDNLDRNKKFTFWMNPGVVKLSTIASFKGWEIPELFLIINESKENKYSREELIYTAITRCRHNLHIINLGNKIYYDFFKKNSDLVLTKNL